MDETLHRLLDTELRAEAIARQAEQDSEQIIQQTLQKAQAEAERFESSLPELYASFRSKAEARAEQIIHELNRRHEENHRQIRYMAEQHDEEALEAAFHLLISPEAGD